MNKLSREEGLQLIKEYQATKNNKILAVLINEYMGFIKKWARYYKQLPEDQEDLISEGVIGLINAVNKCDLNEEGHFLAYANMYIRGKMLEYMEERTDVYRRHHVKFDRFWSKEKSVADDWYWDNFTVDSLTPKELTCEWDPTDSYLVHDVIRASKKVKNNRCHRYLLRVINNPDMSVSEIVKGLKIGKSRFNTLFLEHKNNIKKVLKGEVVNA